MVTAEILGFGDELTSGQRIDTNSAWLSQKLEEFGISTICHTTLGDDIHMSSAAIKLAASRSRVVICTGGLGPTEDDLTRESLADALGVGLELVPDALAHIQGLFARRGRIMPERNRIQAMCPQGGSMIPNPEGTAPGIRVEFSPGGCLLYALPGVPAEMKQMWSWIEQDLRGLGLIQSRIVRMTIKTFGFGESQIGEMLGGILDRGRNPLVGITAHEATISLRIAAFAENEATAELLAEDTARQIRATLGDLIFSERDDCDLPEVLTSALAARNWTVATAEWQTAGELARGLSQTPGNPRFCGGILGADESILAAWAPAEGASENILQIARLLRQRFRADVGIAFGNFSKHGCGRAGPGEGDLLDGAIVTPTREHVFRHRWGGHSSVVRIRAAKEAWMQAFRLVRDLTS